MPFIGVASGRPERFLKRPPWYKVPSVSNHRLKLQLKKRRLFSNLVQSASIPLNASEDGAEGAQNKFVG
jgi:hypothetical protein